jgi:cyanophycinase
MLSLLPRGVASLVVLFWAWGGLAAADPADEGGPPRGTLVIAGGALRFDNSAVWTRIVDAAGGKGSTVVVLPLASRSPQRAGNLAAEALRNYGADAVVAPAQPDEEFIQKVAAAGGVYFTGGEQRRIVEALVAADGKPTPLLSAVWQVYRRGGVVAGTSAGAAVMSRVMFKSPRWVLHVLLNGVQMGREIDRGLGFLDGQWFIDQHAITRGRFARTVVAMKDQGFKLGLGIDENTAVVVRRPERKQDAVAEVIGYRGALLLDLTEAESNGEVAEFNVRNVKVSYLDRGDAINLRTREVTPSPEKRAGRKLEPQFVEEPSEPERPLFFNDILANSTVLDLLCLLAESKRRNEATGLAFDGPTSQKENAKGFEFKFYRAKDTTGWYTSVWGDEAYTVLNVRLDIRPIRMSGPPLYYEPAGNKATGER